MESPLEKFRNDAVDKITTLDIVSSLMTDDNIEMKTEIENPYALDVLMLYASYFKEHGAKNAYEILKKWKKKLLKFMVSNKRESRKEITEILKGYFALERERDKVSLTSNLAKINNQNKSF